MKKRPILFEWSLVLPCLSYPFSKFTYLKTCLIVRHSYDLILIGQQVLSMEARIIAVTL